MAATTYSQRIELINVKMNTDYNAVEVTFDRNHTLALESRVGALQNETSRDKSSRLGVLRFQVETFPAKPSCYYLAFDVVTVKNSGPMPSHANEHDMAHYKSNLYVIDEIALTFDELTDVKSSMTNELRPGSSHGKDSYARFQMEYIAFGPVHRFTRFEVLGNSGRTTLLETSLMKGMDKLNVNKNGALKEEDILDIESKPLKTEKENYAPSPLIQTPVAKCAEQGKSEGTNNNISINSGKLDGYDPDEDEDDFDEEEEFDELGELPVHSPSSSSEGSTPEKVDYTLSQNVFACDFRDISDFNFSLPAEDDCEI